MLAAARELAGPVEIDPTPQEVASTVTLDEDVERAAYDPDQVAAYFATATAAALVLAEFRAPYRRRSTQVKAWWESPDLAMSLYSGCPPNPPSDDFIMRDAIDAPGGRRRLVARRHPLRQSGVLRLCPPRAAGVRRGGIASPAHRALGPKTLGEYLVDWDDLRSKLRPARRPRSSSRIPCSVTRARCVTGTRRCRQVRRGLRRRSIERVEPSSRKRCEPSDDRAVDHVDREGHKGCRATVVQHQKARGLQQGARIGCGVGGPHARVHSRQQNVGQRGDHEDPM